MNKNYNFGSVQKETLRDDVKGHPLFSQSMCMLKKWLSL